MIMMNDLRKVAEELNIKLDLTPKIRRIGISREDIIEQILDAAELILPHDDITKFSNKIIEDIKIPKEEKTEENQNKRKDIKVKVKVEKKKVNKSNKYDLMFKKVKVNKKIVKDWVETSKQEVIKIIWKEENIIPPWYGWVIGYRKKREGTKIQKEGQKPEFTCKNTVNCVLVIKNPTSNPIPVPMDGFDIVE